MEPAAHPPAGSDPRVPGDLFTNPAYQLVPLLSLLFTLWLPGDLQIRRDQGQPDGRMANPALQPIQQGRLRPGAMILAPGMKSSGEIISN